MTHPAVIECAITGVPDEIRGQVVKATIVLAKEYKGKEGEALIKELQNHVKKVTAPYKYPRVIGFPANHLHLRPESTTKKFKAHDYK
mgnify:CR=1 FL=1